MTSSMTFFLKWCKTKKCTEYCENVLLAHFTDKAKTLKSSNLWTMYSMRRATLNAKNDLGSQYKRLITFRKNKSVGYQPNKSKTFSREDIEKFLLDAPDDRFLMMKVHLYHAI